jgi:hypothetical protein
LPGQDAGRQCRGAALLRDTELEFPDTDLQCVDTNLECDTDLE